MSSDLCLADAFSQYFKRKIHCKVRNHILLAFGWSV